MEINSISIADREQGEKDITKSQINYIKHFVQEREMDKVKKLGTLQALLFVEQMEREKGDQIANTASKFQKPCIGVITVIAVIVITALFVIVMK